MQVRPTTRFVPQLVGLNANSAIPRRFAVVVRADFSEPNLDDTVGVDTLLQRDYKGASLDINEAAFADPIDLNEVQQSGNGKKAEQGSRVPAAQGGFTRCRQAIDAGLSKYEQGDFSGALELFQLALELPGSGFMRMAGSPKEYACASEGEENSSLFNMACCYCKMNKPAAALTCLTALLENNFDDFAAIRTDPDLAAVRGAELEKLIGKYDNLLNKVFGKKKKTTEEKPWIQW